MNSKGLKKILHLQFKRQQKAIAKRVEKMVVVGIAKRKQRLVLGGGVSWRRNY
jgi:hypothetical protein